MRWPYGAGKTVWGRSPEELTIRISDPVGRGLLRERLSSPATGGCDASLDNCGIDRELNIDDVSAISIDLLPHAGDDVILRPVLGKDHLRVERARRNNWLWLSPWEATLPPGSSEELPGMVQYMKDCDRKHAEATILLMSVEIEGQVCGLFTLSNVQWGSMCQGILGYWLVRAASGCGLGSLCAAAIIDMSIGELGVHRIEVNVRPENGPSMGMCRKLLLREEGLKRDYMCIAGKWADHVGFAISSESLPRGGLVEALWGTSLS